MLKSLVFLAFSTLMAPGAGGAKGDLFEVSFSNSMVHAIQGKSGEAELVLAVVVKDGYVHSKSPFKVSLQSDGVKLVKSEMKRNEAKTGGDEDKSRLLKFSIPFKAEKKGAFDIKADVEFFLCTAKICKKESGSATVKVEVL